MLSKETCVHLAVLIAQCFGWPEGKPLELRPNQGVGLTLCGKHKGKTKYTFCACCIYTATAPENCDEWGYGGAGLFRAGANEFR